jgi:hypothetical protein
MKSKLVIVALALAAAFGFCSGIAAGHSHSLGANHAVHAASTSGVPEPLAHVRSEFHFTVHAPMAVAAPLFGPEGERAWGGSDWDPNFLFPLPAQDVEGAVFLVQHGGYKSTWVATELDFTAGHIQYVNIIDGAMAVRIDIHLAAAGPSETAATIVYERTALQSELNEHIKGLAEGDANSGLHWESAINGYLKLKSQSKQ